ncbi:MAG: DNA double-strand break repair nuclease NurA [Sulfolobales archaeon]
MLPKTYDIAYTLADRILGKLDTAMSLEILEKVQEKWIRYIPRDKSHYKCIAGVDSGYNWAELRGFFIYVINAGYMDTCSERDEEIEIDIKTLVSQPHEYLDLRSIFLELKILNRTLEKRDARDTLILVDGSLISKLFAVMRSVNTPREIEFVRELLEEINRLLSRDLSNTVFVSKNSGSQELVKRVINQSDIPDLYLLEEFTSGIGFTEPYTTTIRFFDREININISYVRSDVRGPVIRVEYMNENKSFIKTFIDSLHEISVGGYPSILLVIDRSVRVEKEDLEKVLSLLEISRRKPETKVRIG